MAPAQSQYVPARNPEANASPARKDSLEACACRSVSGLYLDHEARRLHDQACRIVLWMYPTSPMEPGCRIGPVASDVFRVAGGSFGPNKVAGEGVGEHRGDRGDHGDHSPDG